MIFIKVLFDRTSVVALPISVSLLVGKDKVPVFIIVDILGLVNVLFVSVCVAVRVTTVSDMSGKDTVLFAVCTLVIVKVVPVVAPEDTKPIFLVLSELSTKNTLPSIKFLLDNVCESVVPTTVPTGAPVRLLIVT